MARPLTGDRIIQAFALVQELYPDLSLSDWRRIADPGNKGGGAEVMSLQTAGGSIHAVFVCRQGDDLLLGRMMLVDPVIVYDLPGRGEALHALVRVVEQMARDRHCSAIDITLLRNSRSSSHSQQYQAQKLCDVGYFEHGLRMRRSIAALSPT